MDIDQLIEQLDADSRAFDCQLGCEEPSMENAVYEQLNELNRDVNLRYQPDSPQYACVDYGYSVDASAVHIANCAASFIHVWYERLINNCDEDTMLPILQELAYLYKIQRWAVDPSARVLRDKMIAAGMDVFTQKIEKDERINNLAYFICSGRNVRRFKYNPKRCPNLHLQLSSYWRKPNGKPTEDRKDGHHWDCCDSVGYLANMCRGSDAGHSTIRESWSFRRSGDEVLVR